MTSRASRGDDREKRRKSKGNFMRLLRETGGVWWLIIEYYLRETMRATYCILWNTATSLAAEIAFSRLIDCGLGRRLRSIEISIFRGKTNPWPTTSTVTIASDTNVGLSLPFIISLSGTWCNDLDRDKWNRSRKIIFSTFRQLEALIITSVSEGWGRGARGISAGLINLYL